MFAPLAKSADWLAIQLVWGRRCRALLKQQGNGSSSRLEEAIDFLHGPDFAPAEVPSARLEFEPAEGGRRFRFVTPRPSGFAESNVACGRLYRCGDQWRERPAVILLHGAGGADYRYEFPWTARRCNRAGFNAAMLLAPFQVQRRPHEFSSLRWPDYLLEAQICYAQAIAEIRALLGWLLEQGCPRVAVWGNSYGGNLAGLTACCEPRLSAAVLSAPGLNRDVFLSAARHVASPRLRKQLLKQRPACEALDQTVLNLTVARPCIPRESILLIEAMYDLWVPAESMEALWQAWDHPDIWRLPHSHTSRHLSPGLTSRILRWLKPPLAEKPRCGVRHGFPMLNLQKLVPCQLEHEVGWEAAKTRPSITL